MCPHRDFSLSLPPSVLPSSLYCRWNKEKECRKDSNYPLSVAPRSFVDQHPMKMQHFSLPLSQPFFSPPLKPSSVAMKPRLFSRMIYLDTCALSILRVHSPQTRLDTSQQDSRHFVAVNFWHFLFHFLKTWFFWSVDFLPFWTIFNIWFYRSIRWISRLHIFSLKNRSPLVVPSHLESLFTINVMDNTGIIESELSRLGWCAIGHFRHIRTSNEGETWNSGSQSIYTYIERLVQGFVVFRISGTIAHCVLETLGDATRRCMNLSIKLLQREKFSFRCVRTKAFARVNLRTRVSIKK